MYTHKKTVWFIKLLLCYYHTIFHAFDNYKGYNMKKRLMDEEAKRFIGILSSNEILGSLALIKTLL